MAKKEVAPSVVQTVRRIDIQRFTLEDLKHGPRIIRALYDGATQAAADLAAGDSLDKAYRPQSQAEAFKRVLDILDDPKETEAPSDLARAGKAVRFLAGWYRETLPISGRINLEFPQQISSADDGQIIANNQAIAFSASLEALGQPHIVEQINAEIKAEKASTT
jgi:hypothetical protein